MTTTKKPESKTETAQQPAKSSKANDLLDHAEGLARRARELRVSGQAQEAAVSESEAIAYLCQAVRELAR